MVSSHTSLLYYVKYAAEIVDLHSTHIHITHVTLYVTQEMQLYVFRILDFTPTTGNYYLVVTG